MLEFLIYLGLLGFCAAQPALRELARSIALPYRVASASLILLLVAGQLARSGALTFPFMPWDMYTRSAPVNPVVFEYTGVTRSGDERRIDVLSHADAIGLHWPLLGAITRYTRAPTPQVRAEQTQQCQGFLRAITAAYNAREDREPIQRLRVWRREVPLQGYEGLESIRRELLWEGRADPEAERLDGV
jgi:hypothetical protein